jgi:hypothetical protein
VETADVDALFLQSDNGIEGSVNGLAGGNQVPTSAAAWRSAGLSRRNDLTLHADNRLANQTPRHR